MAWNKFVVTTRDALIGTGIKVTLSKRGDKPARLIMTFTQERAKAFGWCGGDKLEVMMGDGEHQGRVRLRKNNSAAGSAELEEKATAVGNKLPYFKVNFGVVPSLADRSEAARWAECELVDAGWVEIILPSWAVAAPKVLPSVSVGASAAQFQRPRRDAASALMGDPPAGRSALDAKRG